MDLTQELYTSPETFIGKYGTNILYNILQHLEYNDIMKVFEHFKDACQQQRFQNLINDKYVKYIRLAKEQLIKFILTLVHSPTTTMSVNISDDDFNTKDRISPSIRGYSVGGL